MLPVTSLHVCGMYDNLGFVIMAEKDDHLRMMRAVCIWEVCLDGIDVSPSPASIVNVVLVPVFFPPGPMYDLDRDCIANIRVEVLHREIHVEAVIEDPCFADQGI